MQYLGEKFLLFLNISQVILMPHRAVGVMFLRASKTRHCNHLLKNRRHPWGRKETKFDFIYHAVNFQIYYRQVNGTISEPMVVKRLVKEINASSNWMSGVQMSPQSNHKIYGWEVHDQGLSKRLHVSAGCLLRLENLPGGWWRLLPWTRENFSILIPRPKL